MSLLDQLVQELTQMREELAAYRKLGCPAALLADQHELALYMDQQREQTMSSGVWCCQAAGNSDGWLHSTDCRHFGKAR